MSTPASNPSDQPLSRSEWVLQAQDLGKEYKIYDSPGARFKSLLFGSASHRSHWALKGVSFSLKRGQCMGLIGDNGAGKSTLLKLLTGTLQPTQGGLQRVGRLTAILELGAGFHPDFTGRDNLYFGGSLIGIDAAQMAQLEAGIIAFSELGAAIDRPVKTYSSGMAVRLAFALITAVEPDVLIIDEALAVGDQHFQKKCIDRIDAFRANGCTILFCSHSLYHVRHLCDVSLWLDGGQVRGFGDTDSVLSSYEAHVRQKNAPLASPEAPEALPDPAAPQANALSQPTAQPADRAAITSVQVDALEQGHEMPMLRSKDLIITVEAQVPGDTPPSIGLMLEQWHGVGITSLASHAEGVTPRRVEGDRWRLTLQFPDLPLHSGDYVLSAYLFDEKGLMTYDEWKQCTVFKWVSPSLTPGLVRLPHRWITD